MVSKIKVSKIKITKDAEVIGDAEDITSVFNKINPFDLLLKGGPYCG